MEDWFSLINTNCELTTNPLRNLQHDGFVVIPGPFESTESPRISATYDSVVSSASPDDVRIGSSTTRVNGFFDLAALYAYRPLLEACNHVIGEPFKLSSMHARTLHPKAPRQRLHIDFKPNEERFPLAGFIFMVDEFRDDNGATGFVRGSHKWSATPNDLTDDDLAHHENKMQIAVGKPGSLIVFSGSAWHGHTANLTDRPRRSIQGAFIPRDGRSGIDLKSRINLKTLSQITPLAKYLLAIQ